MDQVNDTTYKSVAGDIETVVGDEKQSDFLPRVKIKKWNNEVNFSVGLKNVKGNHRKDKDKIIFEAGGTKAEFYTVPKAPSAKTSKKLRWLALGGIEPYQVAAEYELSRHLPANDITIATYFCNTPALMYFGQYKTSDYVANVDIPQVRAASFMGNPYYMDPGLIMIDIHFNGNNEDNALKLWTQATQEVLKSEYGIDSYTQNGMKLYYKDPQGNDVKISSPEWRWGHIWTYLNIDSDYLKAYDYYKSSRPKDIRDKYAYGIKKNYPSVDSSVVEKIVQRFAQLTRLDISADSYTPAEKDMIASLKDTLTSNSWVQEGKRDDFDWWYVDPATKNDDKFEFGITLDQPPASNIIPLSIQTKELRFFYQDSEANENSYRPYDVIGSYAVYHATKSNDQYKTGKAFHIYRPWAQDAKGNKVWCDLHIDVDGNGYTKKDEITITIPQPFLNSAVYPIFIDPTFGYTSQGASNTVIGDSNGSGIFTLINQAGSEVGVPSSMSAYVSVTTSGTALNYKYGIYSSTSKYLSGKTAISANFTTNQAAALQTLNFNAVKATDLDPTTPDTRNINYDLAIWANADPANYDFTNIYYDTQTNAGFTYTGPTNPSGNPWPQNLSTGATAIGATNARYSIYVTYTAVSTNIYRIAEQDISLSTTSSLISCNYPSRPIQNNLLVAIAYSNKPTGTNTMTSSGWTSLLDQGINSNAASLTIWAKIAGSSEAFLVQVSSASATSMNMAIFEITGNVSSSVAATQDQAAAAQSNASATSAATPSITTANANDLILAVCAFSANFSGNASWSNSYNMVGAQARLLVGELITTSTTTTSSTASWSTSRPSATAILSFKAAAATTGKNLPTLGVG